MVAKREKLMGVKGMTPFGEIVYPEVFEPKVNPFSGKAEFTANLLFDSDTDLSAMEDAVNAAFKEGVEKWFGGDTKKLPKGKKTNPITRARDWITKRREREENDPDLKPKPDFWDGKVYFELTTGADFPPSVRDRFNQDITDETELSNGDVCRVAFIARFWNVNAEYGVKLYLQGVQKKKDGEYEYRKADFDEIDDDDLLEEAMDAGAEVAEDDIPFEDDLAEALG